VVKGHRLDSRAAGTAVAAAILLSSCATFMNSELAGHLLGAARGLTAGAGGIEGTVLDVTGNAVVVQDEISHTIFTIRAPVSDLPKMEPGLTVRAAGSFDSGILVPQRVHVTGGSRWPAPVVHEPEVGRIGHVLLLMQENHSFDNYFGTFPGVDGPSVGLSVEGVSPFRLDTPVTQNLSHSLSTARAALHDSRMDRFVSAEGSRDTMGFYDQRDIPSYWAYAAHFTLADRFFCSAVGPSMPNHLFAVAARSDGVTTNVMKPPEGGLTFPALPERLQSAGVSWKAYVGDKDPQAFSALNPLPGFRSFKQNAALRSGLVPNVELFRDLRDGTLPSVGWIFPNGEESEHPLTDIRVGMRVRDGDRQRPDEKRLLAGHDARGDLG
jgi:phospholipase C